MNESLLLTALTRRGAPGTAGDVFDAAMGLAMSANWPRRTWEQSSVKTVSRLLQSLESRGEVLRAGARKEGGRDVPLYGVARYDLDAPMPARPDPVGPEHPLNGMNRRQMFVLFDAQDVMLQALTRQHGELRALVDRHLRDLADLAQRTRRDLLDAGLEGS